MDQEDRYKIYSEDFVELIIKYNIMQSVLQKYEDYTIATLNPRQALVFVPVEDITAELIRDFGYQSIPKCYGLDNEASLEASGIQRVRNTPALDLRGNGTLIGIIDTGIDYTNPIFHREDGTSRIIRIWDQTIDSIDQYPEFTADVEFGTEYTQEQIDLAINSPNPLEIVPSTDEIGHGTMMAGVAAGNEVPESNFSGVAPEADIIVVKLKQAKELLRNFYVIPLDVPCYQENDIILGVQYVRYVSNQLQRPVVMCLGLGTSQGPHSGRGNLSHVLSVIGDIPGMVITTAAGNEGNKRRHFFGEIDPQLGYQIVELNIGEEEIGFTMEIWGYMPGIYTIDILTPDGEYIPRIPEGIQVSREVTFLFSGTILNVDYQLVQTYAGSEVIVLRFRNPSPGIWTFKVYARGIIRNSFHIWLPMDNFITESTYFIQSNPYTTITSPGNTLMPITTTAYNPVNGVLYQQASKGYNRNDEVKPDLAAPGVGILSPNLDQGFSQVSGTSVATAHMAGIVAMMLEWGVVKGNYPDLDTQDVKIFLIRGARRQEGLLYPNRDWGYGIVDIYNTFNVIRPV